LKTSIRKFLLINLLLAISITTTLTVIGNYYLDQQDIQAHVNALREATASPSPSHPYEQIIGLNQHELSSHELGWRIIVDDLYIMLLTFPLSGLLIWIIIGRGLDSLNRVAEEVANREPTHLEPMSLVSVPEEIRPLIDELNHLFSRLQDGFDREKRFAADAAHELRTPLAAIKAQAQVALNSPHEEEKNAALHKVIASVNRSTHIVQQLLTMSKLLPDSPPQNNHFDKVQLTRIAREVLAMLTPAALEKEIELELEQVTSIPTIQGNPTALSILLRNLIDNAIRYSPSHGFVRIRILRDEDQVILEVCDQGRGIPKELHKRVFERFFRILGNKTTGSGLGLAIVQQICNLHQATISLHTPLKGKGLIVRICFPLTKE
jgi:two-component system sensor histidine kinase QseC